MKIFSILAIVPCLSLQVASSSDGTSALGSDESKADKSQNEESDKKSGPQVRSYYSGVPPPVHFQPIFQMDAMRLRKFADYLKANMIDFNAIIQTYDSSLEREDANTINGLIMETSTQLHSVREALNPRFAQPFNNPAYGQHVPPSSYPDYGAYSQPASHGFASPYGQP
ncbi:hypothetical protein DSO57_1007092 [Entomophthora muscae]|uniref:Uncharacterized protein n=1 Tax=Entomophthora muscae TaxID=34485 RepID=A0ACC2TV78_9FUNG|nr:hypothetical protein DSO57_1007092 [Entomophthora muscae]